MVLAVSVARKLAKATKIICIDGAEALDPETWQALRTEIDADGFTYFVTKVGEAFTFGKLDDRRIKMDHGQVLQ